MIFDAEVIQYEKFNLPFVLVGMGFTLITAKLFNVTDLIFCGTALMLSGLAIGYLYRKELYKVVELAGKTAKS